MGGGAQRASVLSPPFLSPERSASRARAACRATLQAPVRKVEEAYHGGEGVRASSFSLLVGGGFWL